MILCVALLGGCAGAGSTHAVPPQPGGYPDSASASNRATSSGAGDKTFAGIAADPDAHSTGTLTLQVSVPKKRGSEKSYVSPATKGVLLVISGASNVTKAFALIRRNPNCSKSQGELACTISVSLAPGTYTTTVNLYDQAPVNGQIPYSANLLSEALNIPFSITKGQTTTISPALEGVPASLSIANLPQPCTAIPPTPFTVTAFDADNYTIVGTYAASIALTDGDTSGATTIATRGKDNPPADTLLSSSDVATIAWNGNPIPGGAATIGAQAGSAKVYTSAQFTVGVTPGSTVLSYTGGFQYFTVPNCATSVFVIASGAQGGHDLGSNGGLGGDATGTIPTTPGETLVAVVGGAGFGDTVPPPNGGYNGGGNGAGYCPPSFQYCDAGAGGGGATDVRQGGSGLGNRVVVAGGGGGAGAQCCNLGDGGAGGGLTGGGGTGPASGCFIPPNPGAGGTQTSGGRGGADSYYPSHSNDGSFGSGGPGYFYCADTTAGGGGGGWYGGGGGFVTAGGGGGSGYVEPSATNVFMANGVQSGNGSVEVCWGFSNNECGPADRKKRK